MGVANLQNRATEARGEPATAQSSTGLQSKRRPERIRSSGAVRAERVGATKRAQRAGDIRFGDAGENAWGHGLGSDTECHHG
ncbi:MAG: hypothetical protein EBU66_12370 [Bacteroidetes bacterium]|nr:hypothetical protein [bacterium]NBP65439.1 hypothetical protein [Bacteroidota bacterium]